MSKWAHNRTNLTARAHTEQPTHIPMFQGHPIYKPKKCDVLLIVAIIIICNYFFLLCHFLPIHFVGENESPNSHYMQVYSLLEVGNSSVSARRLGQIDKAHMIMPAAPDRLRDTGYSIDVASNKLKLRSWY